MNIATTHFPDDVFGRVSRLQAQLYLKLCSRGHYTPIDTLSLDNTPSSAINAKLDEACERLASRKLLGSDIYILSITTTKPQHFDIDVMCTLDAVTVNIGGLAQEFLTIEDAMPWVRRALSPDYRLRTEVCWDRPIAWALEPVHSKPDSFNRLASGNFSFLNLLGKKSHYDRQNDFL
jgi:hypothetical protein